MVYRFQFAVKKRFAFEKAIIMLAILFLCFAASSAAQTAEELIDQVKAKIDKVNDYKATGNMKTNVAFIKTPVAMVNIYFKKPGKLRIVNEKGISFIPKGAVNMNPGTIFTSGQYAIIDAGKESNSGLRIIKLLPTDESADVVLATLYIDEKKLLVIKSKTTTKENGTFELEMEYGKYAAYGLADKVIFSFNTSDYKLPKGVTFDYDDGAKKQQAPGKMKEKKGKVEILYSSYLINKGVADSIFQ